MPDYFRWPYDEVTAELGADGLSIVVTTPWISATVGVALDSVAKVRTLAAKLKA